jgi:hypothetical protein
MSHHPPRLTGRLVRDRNTSEALHRSLLARTARHVLLQVVGRVVRPALSGDPAVAQLDVDRLGEPQRVPIARS